MHKYTLPITVTISLFCLSGYAQHVDSVKKCYHIFNPVPGKEMRDMQTDRPDVTESAYTVDAGHFQYETDAIKLIRNKDGDLANSQIFYNLANIKIGITNSTDLQLVVESFVTNKTKNTITNSTLTSSGFGDLTLRLKQNFWGNNGGKTALAIMPYINIPTSKFSDDKRIDGGVIIPFALELKNNWNLGAQVEIDVVKNDESKSYHGELLNSVTLGKELSDKFSAFVESYYTYNFKEKQVDAYANGGLVYSVSPNFKIDTGLNYGLTKSSDKVYFVGFSFRY